MMSRSHNAVLSTIACLTAILVFTPAMAATPDHDTTLLDSFGALPPNRTIIVGEITGAKHGELINPYGRKVVRPRIMVSVSSVLAGHAEATEEFWGQNSFEFKAGYWTPRVVVGTSWLLPGNTAILIVDDFDKFKATDGTPVILRQIRRVLFLMDSSPTPGSIVYVQSGTNIHRANAAVSTPEASLEDIMRSVEQVFEPTEYTLSDVVGAIAAAKEGRE
jgi:hypothetical protein